MLLAIDVGNTQIVIGLYDGEQLLDHWRIATNDERTSDEHASLINDFLGFHGFSFDDDVHGLVISSGVPRITASLREMSERYFGFPPVIVEAGVKTGMPVLYENPREVGPDRIANAVGAFDMYGGPTVIVEFGSPTTLQAGVGPRGAKRSA